MAEVEADKFDRTSATVGQLLDKWLEAAEIEPATADLYENKRKIEGRIRPVLGSVRLDKLGADTLDAAYRGWLAEGLSPTTVHMYHAILSAACRQAVKWGWIDTAPTARATPPKVERKEMVVPTPEQLSALVKAADELDPVLATAVALAALTGAAGASWWRCGGATSTSGPAGSGSPDRSPWPGASSTPDRRRPTRPATSLSTTSASRCCSRRWADMDELSGGPSRRSSPILTC